MFDSVSKITGLFAKLITRLERVIEKEQMATSKRISKITKLEEDNAKSTKEITSAQGLIKKFEEFTV